MRDALDAGDYRRAERISRNRIGAYAPRVDTAEYDDPAQKVLKQTPRELRKNFRKDDD